MPTVANTYPPVANMWCVMGLRLAYYDLYLASCDLPTVLQPLSVPLWSYL